MSHIRDNSLRVDGKKVGGQPVLCGYCKMPISVAEFGGVIGGELFHSACLVLRELSL